MQKYIRRHKALATGLAAVLLVMLVGIAGILIFAVKADRQARIAEAVTDFLGEDLLGAVALQQAMNQEVTVRSILDAASERLKGKFADKPLVEASIRQYLGQTYIELGDYKQAEPHLQRAYEIRQRQLGERDLLTLDSMSQLGRLHLLQGRFSEAENMLTQALELRRHLLGAEHTDTLQTSVWLGTAYAALAKKKAEQLLPSTYESCDRLFGKNNLITLEAMYGLAFLRIIQGRHDDAEPLIFEGWEIAEELLGEGHRLTLDFMGQGAWFEARDGQFEKAVLHASTALQTCQRVLGREHPHTIMAMGGLGHTYFMQHKYELAEPLLAESTELGRSILGAGHDWILFYRFILGDVLAEQGKYQQAESIYEEVLADARRVFPDGHFIVRNIVGRMMRLYIMWEKADKLEGLCSKELDRLARANDSNRYRRASILNALAWWQATYPSAKIRNGAKAIENAKKACEMTTGWNKANSFDTLAAAYAEVGDFAAAVSEQEKAIELIIRQGNKSAPKGFERRRSLYKSGRAFRESVLTSRARERIAEAKYDLAEQELTALLKSMREHLGEAHPETRGCIPAFIELYEVWNKSDEAEEWRAKLPGLEAAEQ
jgi:tetratricopeptide (TPR) repeat protein